MFVAEVELSGFRVNDLRPFYATGFACNVGFGDRRYVSAVCRLGIWERGMQIKNSSMPRMIATL